MRTRWAYVYAGLLGLSVVSTASAGRYERTKDGKTLVWNEDPKRGALVTWSGSRDEKGYATGYGTVTWYAPEKATLIGSFIARPRHYTVSSRISGTMLHGKLEEMPAAEPKTKERPNIPDRRPNVPPARSEATPQKVKVTPAPEKATSPAPSGTPNSSLDSLMHVPSSLKLNSPAAGFPSPSSPSPTNTPDMSLQLAPVEPPSPSPH